MFYDFNSHPAPGFHADGTLVVQTPKTQGVSKPRKLVKADCGDGGFGGSGLGGGGMGQGGGGGGGFGGFGFGSPDGGAGFGGMASSPNVEKFNPVRDRLDEGSVIEDWIPRDASGLNEMFKLMYHRDHIAGTIVDLLAETIWSDFDLLGIDDPEMRDVYLNSMHSVDPETSMPDLLREFLVMGRTASSMIFNPSNGLIVDLASHDPGLIRVTPIPIKGFDPKIDLIPSPALRQFVESNDPRDVDARKILPEAFIQAIKQASGGGGSGGGPISLSGGSPYGGHNQGPSIGGIQLDPVNTLFLARRRFSFDYVGTSLFTRIINFWALEKALINSSVISARRRARAILHVKMGIDGTWEPSPEEMSNMVGLWTMADEDPHGAVVVTRTGVDTNEIRQGNDFYKWADEWTMLNEGKLRALGANEALLCLTGDTLIPTREHGIIRIDSFGEEGSVQQFTTTGRLGTDNTKRWLYSGRGEALEVGTFHGNTIRCTPGHQILALNNNDLVWKRAEDLAIGDRLCLSKEKCVRSTPLELDLITPAKKKYANSFNERVVKPVQMTPDLAYIIGIIVSEGHIDKYRLRVSNTNIDILNGVKAKLHKVFGDSVKIAIYEVRTQAPGRERADKHGTIWRNVKQAFSLEVWSMSITSYLNQLGLTQAPGRQSRNKEVPWSILEADEQSQLAYLAAYVDGDGSVKRDGKEITIYSFSKKILMQTQILLNTHGAHSVVRDRTVRVTCGGATDLNNQLARYSLSGKFAELTAPEIPNREYGIPTNGINRVLEERFVRQVVNVGSVFRNDQGEEVTIHKFGRVALERWKCLLYCSYTAGEYDEFLSAFKQISKTEHAKVVELFDRKFKYTEVVSVEKLPEEVDLYDIQMEKDPSFTANGVVVHNSGDATYSNQETARSFFMERASALRDNITTRVFYNRMFPLLARIHGFRRISQANVAHGVRTKSSITQREAFSIPYNELIIPKIQWHKQLVNKFDEKMMDVLERLKDQGLPVLLRDWANAGNMDLDTQMSGLDEDERLRQTVARWKKSSEDQAGAAEDEAKLEFVNHMRRLAHSQLNQIVGSADGMKDLGPLGTYLFWGQEGRLGPLHAKDLAAFLKTIQPDNSSAIIGNAAVLSNHLLQHFRHELKAEIAHYLMYRTKLTPFSPALSGDAIGVIAEHVKASLDTYAGRVQVYQLAKLAEAELKVVAGCSATVKRQAQHRTNRTAKNTEAAVKKNIGFMDTIPSSNVNLYSGV